MTKKNHKPIWLILSLIALAVITVTITQVIGIDTKTDLAIHETQVPR